MPNKKKFLAGAALTASLTAGGLAGAMLGSPAVSSAETGQEERVDRAEHPAGGRSGEIGPANRPGPSGEERSASPGDREGRRGHHARALVVEAAADALDMTSDQLKTELRNGKSVRAVAEERGVDVQVVIDAIVAAITEHAEERATEFVDRERPADGEGRNG